jgi:hypothetical protein
MGSLVYDDPVSGVRMLTSCDGMPFLAGKLWVLQKGLVFTSNRLGSVVVDFEHDLVSAEFYTSSESVAFRLREGFASFGILEVMFIVIANRTAYPTLPSHLSPERMPCTGQIPQVLVLLFVVCFFSIYLSLSINPTPPSM